MNINTALHKDHCIRIKTEPYAHFFLENTFNEDAAGRLLSWLHEDACWRLHSSSFFEQYELDLSHSNAPEECRWVFSEKLKGELRDAMQSIFGTELQEHVQVTAHRLIAGQKIGIHNDNPSTPDKENYRLVWQLNSGWQEKDGGKLVLFSSRDPSSIHTIIHPQHNSCVAFECSENSFHGVSTIQGGCRYSVIFSFWKVATISKQNNEEATKADGRRKATIEFLRNQGSDNMTHSGDTFLNHLLGVEKILSRWEVSEDLRLAGLLHSIYGTEGYPSDKPPERTTIRNLVGETAERWAYQYAHMDRYRFLCCVENPALPLYDRQQMDLSCSQDDLAALISLDLANMAEQLPRLCHDTHMVADDRSAYLLMRPMATVAAREEMDSLFLLLDPKQKITTASEVFDTLCTHLENSGADTVTHSGTSLREHIVQLHELLLGWEASDIVRLAAVAQCLYGWLADSSEKNRCLLRMMLGDQAERLAYLYAYLPVDERQRALEYYLNDPHQGRVVLYTSPHGNAQSITLADLEQLYFIEYADYMEQSRRLAAYAPLNLAIRRAREGLQYCQQLLLDSELHTSAQNPFILSHPLQAIGCMPEDQHRNR